MGAHDSAPPGAGGGGVSRADKLGEIKTAGDCLASMPPQQGDVVLYHRAWEVEVNWAAVVLRPADPPAPRASSSSSGNGGMVFVKGVGPFALGRRGHNDLFGFMQLASGAVRHIRRRLVILGVTPVSPGPMLLVAARRLYAIGGGLLKFGAGQAFPALAHRSLLLLVPAEI